MDRKDDRKGRRAFLKQSLAMSAMATLPFGAAAYAGGRTGTQVSVDKIRKNSGLLESRPFNGPYQGPYLNKVAFPIGGIGAGMFCLEGTGAISHLSVRNKPEMYNEPYAFAAISVRGLEKGAKVLEAPVPGWKLFGPQGSGNGSGHRSYGLPRFESGRFLSRFPFAMVELTDPDIPIEVKITGWSPFIPNDADNSSLPSGALEYHFRNTSDVPIEAVFSYNARNFIDEQGTITTEKNGFRLVSGKMEANPDMGFSIYSGSPDVIVDHCWFRGAWFDPQTILWKHIREAEMVDNPPVEGSAPGASLYIPVMLQAGGEKTLRVCFSWYLPDTNLAFGIPVAAGQSSSENSPSGTAPNQEAARFEDETGEKVPYYRPWYARRFKNLDEVVDYWLTNVDELRKKSEIFRDAFYTSTLPDEVTEAVAANLTILKSPTLLRQYNGKLWGWEGCNDNSGCCAGSCTHVWNYAQAIPHLFPALERTLRETEFNVSQNEEGHQVFRASLPISKAVHDFHSAADGQLGGLMKLYRDWRICGDTNWMKRLYPKARKSIDYCIRTWDPRRLGVLEEPHHNTYDIEFWGPDGMCTSFYLGALTAIIEMSKALGEPYDLYESLLEKGKKAMEKRTL